MIITVQHVAKDGWHEFTCPQVPGFYLLSTEGELASAYVEVPSAIAEIVEADEGFPVEVKMQRTYSEYVGRLPVGMRPPQTHYSVEKLAKVA